MVVTVYGLTLFWFIPPLEVASKLMGTFEFGMKNGDVDIATMALFGSLRFAFFGGQNLSVLSASFRKSIKQMVSGYPINCFSMTSSIPSEFSPSSSVSFHRPDST